MPVSSAGAFTYETRNPGVAIQLRRLFHQRRRPIQPHDLASSKREPARNRAGASPKIERAHPGLGDPAGNQPVEKLIRKSRTMTSIIRGGLSKVGAQILVSDFRGTHGAIAPLNLTVYNCSNLDAS
jgi:hypothetical protein